LNLRSSLSILGLAAVAACFACNAAPAAPPVSGPAADAQAARQVLLMLRAPPPHYRPDAAYGDGYRAAPAREARRRVAKAIAREHGLSPRTDWPMPALGLDCFVLDLPATASVEQVVRDLEDDPRVESAQPMQRFHLLGAGDPLYPAQPAALDWHLAELHRLATGRGVLVAVIDSGVDIAHPDLRGQVAAARDFVDGHDAVAEVHGTGVAGIIAARADNGVGIAGIAPQSHLLALRACSEAPDGTAGCTTFSLAQALQFAIDRKAQVLNLSLSGPRDPLLARLLDAAASRGIAVVAAVDGRAGDGGFPASHAGVLAVTGDDAPRPRAGILWAPGRGIPTTSPDGGWRLVDGSSFAAAQVSGLVALLRGLSPRLAAGRLHGALAPAEGLRLPAERPRPIDACAAVLRVGARCACNCAATSTANQVMPRQ
jgi:subtilisin family serine protease